MYDVKCALLAESFLDDEDPALRTPGTRAALAQAIQDAIEGFLDVTRDLLTPSGVEDPNA